MTGGKVALLITGILIALFGFGAAVAGGGMLWAHSTQAEADGYLTSPTYALATEGYALTTEDLYLGGPSPQDWYPASLRFNVQLEVEPASPGEVFVGVGPRADVLAYLEGVHHDQVSRLGVRSHDVTYRRVEGVRAPEPPGTQAFWVASATGPGAQELTWAADRGAWAIVVMNADGTPGVLVTASAAVEAGFLLPLGIGLLVGGILLLLLGTVLVVVATLSPRGPAAPPAGTAPQHAGTPAVPAPPPAAPRYPVSVAGRLDAPLSRWLWLVKWVLLVPHVVVLVFLWMAFALLTVVAGFAILFTGRYPRGIFDFNVGVIRWTWRVVYYGYGVLGTDRYPPFTLSDVEYPARFDVAYPERLSRGLVLVKWWLLAIPHYIIVGLLVGGGLGWTADTQRWGVLWVGSGTGVIGVLVFVAALVLLFRATYPQGLFDVVMGLNRWVYRVLAYAALMTDAYPPFRFDPGGPEPPATAGQPPGSAGPAAGAEAELVRT